MFHRMLSKTPSPLLYKTSIINQNGFAPNHTSNKDESENFNSVLPTPNPSSFTETTHVVQTRQTRES